MKPTEVLKREHEVIKLMLKILNKVCDKLEVKKAVNQEDLNSIIEFIRTFADKCHHGKEEHRLFPIMEKNGILREGGPIGVMIEEHELGRNYVKNMILALDKKKISKFVENARNYILLLEQHIDKEDNILYPMADIHIKEDEQKKLTEDFEKFEREEIGVGKHEELHKALKRLKDIYLKAKT